MQQIENEMVRPIGYGKRDPQAEKAIDYCDECCQEIYHSDERYIVEFNGDFIHKDCFDTYFKRFIK